MFTPTTNPAQTTVSTNKKRKIVQVSLLTGEDIIVYVDLKSKFQEVFNQVASSLSLREVEYFGLAFKKDNEYQFVALDEKIHKQVPKKWKTGQGEGYDSQHEAIVKVWFRVQFYVDQVVLLREKVTRHLYYLQLKHNVLQYNNITHEEKCFQMVGNALQADYGTYSIDKHHDEYFDPKLYFPAWIIAKRGADYIIQNTPKIHQENRNLTRPDAELKYIKEASITPSAHNLHFYRVRKKKTDKSWNTWLGVCPRGIEVYEEESNGFKNLISTFLWPDIGRLYFDKKKFEIRAVGCPDGRKFTYYTDSDVTSKYLLAICRSTHMFQLEIQPKLMEIRHLDAEDKRRYRESYIYSDTRDLVANGNWIQHRPVKKSPSKSGSSSGNQRYSIVSDVSSNTTSGIVSDKMTISFDESDDHAKEILIDTPPGSGSGSSTTPSTPRSKFSHIINSFHNYKKSSSGQSPASSPRSIELYKPRSPGVTPTQLSPVTSPGTYRPTPVYSTRNPGFSLHSPPRVKSDREPKSRPVSRNVSRKESLKNQLAAQSSEPRQDSTPTSPTTESKTLSMGISVLPSKPSGPFVTSVPTSFTQPFLPVSSPKPSDTTPSPSSSSGIGLTPGSETSLPMYPIGTPGSETSLPMYPIGTPGSETSLPMYPIGTPGSETSLPMYPIGTPGSETSLPIYSIGTPGTETGLPMYPIGGTPGSETSLPLYSLEYSSSNSVGSETSKGIYLGNQTVRGGHELTEPTPPVYNMALSKPISGKSPTEPIPITNIHGLPIATGGLSPSESSSYAMGYQASGLTPQEAQAVFNLSFSARSSDMSSVDSTSGAYNISYTNPVPQQSRIPSPPPYHLSFPTTTSNLKTGEPTPIYHNVGFTMQNPTPTPTYMNLPDPPPYSTALSQLVSDKMPSPGIKPNLDGFNLIPGSSNQSKFSPGITPLSDSAYFPVKTDVKLNEGAEIYQPPMAFADPGVITEIPDHPPHMQSILVPKSADITDGRREAEETRKERKREEKEGTYVKRRQPGQHHYITKKNHTAEKLHPELLSIRSHAQSFPLITALCNDMSLIRTNSSSNGSYDASTMRSTTSRLSGSSCDLDSRRWSACCPSDTGTMVTNSTIRPKSWHSEHFDLETAEFQAGQGQFLLNNLENHRSFPQNLYGIQHSSPPPPTWTNTVTSGTEFRGTMEKYPSEILANQHMIPAKLNSGGHNKADDVNIKTLKETFGMA